MRPWMVSLTLLAIPIAVHADDRDFTGIVTHVFDGDSFLVRPADSKSRAEIDVRLNDIDAPEKDQPHADRSRAALIKLIEGRRVFIDVLEIDRFKRKIAKVYREPDRLEIARVLVRDGQVWVNRKYAEDRSLIELEDKAREAKAGIWSLSDANRVPPWEFRRARKRDGPQKGAKGATNEQSIRPSHRSDVEQARS